VCMWLVCRLVEISRLVGRRCLASVLHGTLDSGDVHDGTSRHCRENWHVFISYLACTWLCCLTVLFANKFLPLTESTEAFFIVGGFLVSVITCAVMPYVQGRSYKTNAFVWRDWTNSTGWTSNGFVFCLGMLNAAFAVCAPGIPSHMAEKIPR
jgi:choline transport protein